MHTGYEYTRQHFLIAADPRIDVIQCDREGVEQEIIDADVVVPLMCSITPSLLSLASKLKLIIQFGVGVEGVDIFGATSLGIFVSNIPSTPTGNAFNAASCAEMAIFLTLATLRNINAMENSIQNRLLGTPTGEMIMDKAILIIGFGNIAKHCIDRLIPFKPRSISVLRRRAEQWGCCDDDDNDEDRHSSHATLTGRAISEKGTWPEDAKKLASTADIIIVACKQDDSNKGLINDTFLEACKTGVRIVNVARGGLLDYGSCVRGLASGKIGALGLDVHFWEPFDPEDPIAKHPNVYLTPHVAGVTTASYNTMAAILAAEIRRVLLHNQKPTVQLNSEEDMPVGSRISSS